MTINPSHLHNLFDPALTKLELLARLSPLLPSDKEYAECLGLIIEMMGDYINQLRRHLDTFLQADDSLEGGRP